MAISNLFYNKADLVVHPPSAKEFHAQLHVHLVLVVHDVDHVPLNLHQHFLRPDAVRLLHCQEPSHPVSRIDEIVLWRDRERGQVLENVSLTDRTCDANS